jgi:benzylsuccinate CoA-transferase BbsF subunit
MLSTCMQGQTGSASRHPGHGVTLGSLSGFNLMTGWPDRIPTGITGPFTDIVASIYSAFVLQAALDYRSRTGKGQYLDLSQYECNIHFIAPQLLDYSVNNRDFERRGNSCSYAAPHGVYRCLGEDRWCAIGVFSDEEWESFCKVLGNPRWTKDEKFSTVLSRLKNSADLDKLIEEWTGNHTPEEIMFQMQNAGVAAGVVQNGRDLWEDPQLKHRNSICELEHPETGIVFCQRVGVTLPEVPYEVRRAPLLGEHTGDICKRVLEMTDDEFITLLNDGVLE